MVTVETFQHEIAEAIKAYDKYVVCVDKVPEDCEKSLHSLMEKAIKAYKERAAKAAEKRAEKADKLKEADQAKSPAKAVEPLTPGR